MLGHVFFFVVHVLMFLNRHREEGGSEISCNSARNAFFGRLFCACVAAHMEWE